MGAHITAFVGFFTLLKWEKITGQAVGYYQEYLGTLEEQRVYQNIESKADPRVPKRGPGPPSTIVCNHTGFIDILPIMCSPLNPGFTPKIEVKQTPGLASFASSVNSVYIKREGSAREREQTVESIIERQH